MSSVPPAIPGAGSMATVAVGTVVIVEAAVYAVLAFADDYPGRGIALMMLTFLAVIGVLSGIRLRRGNPAEHWGALGFAVVCLGAGVIVGTAHHGLLLAVAGIVIGICVVVERGWPAAVARAPENDS